MAYTFGGSVPIEHVELIIAQREHQMRLEFADQISQMKAAQQQFYSLLHEQQAQVHNVNSGVVYTNKGTTEGEPQKQKKEKVQDLIAYYYNRSR